MIGILGGFTTFSTFGYETFAMVREADYLRAAGNVGIHVVLGLATVEKVEVRFYRSRGSGS